MPDESSYIASQTADDGYAWSYRRFEPPQAALGHVVCLHGIQSHSGWYLGSCAKLAQEGFLVSFLDRRGSGMNGEARGDTPGFRRLLDDIAEFIQPLRRQSLPIHLVGISWGGKLVAALQKRHPGLVDSLSLLCPGFCPKVGVSLLQRLRILWARLVSPQRYFPIPLDEPELFTNTPRWLEFLRSDARSLHRATARFFVENARLDGYLRWVPKHVRVPVLLLLAGQDKIIDNQRTKQYVQQFASPEIRVLEYPQAHHTLEFEDEDQTWLRDLVSWLKQRAVQRHPAGA